MEIDSKFDLLVSNLHFGIKPAYDEAWNIEVLPNSRNRWLPLPGPLQGPPITPTPFQTIPKSPVQFVCSTLPPKKQKYTPLSESRSGKAPPKALSRP